MSTSRPEGLASWEAMQALWREQAPSEASASQVRQRVSRQTRLMWLTAAIEGSLVLALVPFTWWYAGDAPSLGRIALLVSMWIINLGFLAFSIINRRGSWQAESESVAAWVELWSRRVRARVRAARFVRLAVMVQAALVVLLVWFDADPAVSLARLRSAATLAMVIVVAYLAWAAWYERRALAELADVASARRALDEADADS